MKKNFLLIISLLLLGTVKAENWTPLKEGSQRACEIKLISTGSESIVLEVSIPGFWNKEVASEKGIAVIPGIENGTPILKAGSPAMPAIRTRA